MVGTTNLNDLLKSMKPELIDGEYIFCTVKEDAFDKINDKALMFYKEKEGITLILKKEIADTNNLPYSCSWSLITLTVHSDLEAVGFLAKISNKLAEKGISVNVVSAYYHDHLFVPIGKAEEAMQLLKELT